MAAGNPVLYSREIPALHGILVLIKTALSYILVIAGYTLIREVRHKWRS